MCLCCAAVGYIIQPSVSQSSGHLKAAGGFTILQSLQFSVSQWVASPCSVASLCIIKQSILLHCAAAAFWSITLHSQPHIKVVNTKQCQLSSEFSAREGKGKLAYLISVNLLRHICQGVSTQHRVFVHLNTEKPQPSTAVKSAINYWIKFTCIEASGQERVVLVFLIFSSICRHFASILRTRITYLNL